MQLFSKNATLEQKMTHCHPLVADAYKTNSFWNILDPEIAKSAFWGEKVGFCGKSRHMSLFRENITFSRKVRKSVFLRKVTFPGPRGSVD